MNTSDGLLTPPITIYFRAEEIAQRVKSLLYEHENLTLYSQHSFIKHLALGCGALTGRSPELINPISEIQVKKETLSQNIKWRVTKDSTHHTPAISMGTHEFTFTYKHIYTPHT